jgi:hypothetical protein
MRRPYTEEFMAVPISRFRRFVSAGVISIAAAAALAVPVSTAPDACPPIDTPSEVAPASPSEAGIRVFIDPATGRIRQPTLAERRRIAASSKAARDRSGRTYEVRTRPDGARIVKLDETFLMSVVATMNPDGTVSYACGTEPAQADECIAENEQ